MIFITGKLLWLALRFSTLVLAAGAIGAGLLWSGRTRWGTRLVSTATLALLLVLVLPVHEWLLTPLEQRFPAIVRAPDQVDGIVVLGGALDTELTEQHGIPALNGAAERMTTFVMLAARYPAAKLAFTGGSGLFVPGRLSEADVARALFGQLGLGRPVTYESRSRNTYENAVLLREELRPGPGETWIILTSAAHMPRAVGSFRAAGWQVLPWPVGYKSGHSLATRLDQGLPDRLQLIDFASHEWVGLVAYWLLGRIPSPFPGPEP